MTKKPTLKAVGTATVGAPGSKQVAKGTISGEIDIEIVKVEPDGGTRHYVYCLYPDGFQRTHQVGDKEDLKEKITKFLWGRYDVVPVGEFVIPAFKEKNIIKVEVK